MRRFILSIVVFAGVGGLGFASPVFGLSSDPKMFISADNTFYAYVKAGETVTADFKKTIHDEIFGTVRGDVTITIDAPGMDKQTCVAPKDVAVGNGCNFKPVVAQKTGIWKIDFAVPADANTYQEVSPVVKWAKNLFSWSIVIASGDTEQHGRVWTERYAIRQPASVDFAVDFENYYISEDGYIYQVKQFGYNGMISTLSADGIGIRQGKNCTSVYHSTAVEDVRYSPALGVCGSGYKLFFEKPAGDLPEKSITWDNKTDWIKPSIKKPSLSELHFNPDSSSDQQSGTISFFLNNFIGQYEIKIDVDNDGSFDGQSDLTLRKHMEGLSQGLQQHKFSGVNRQGMVIPRSQPIGIMIKITRVAEIHLVAADVEGRNGGVELIRLSGENAPTNGICWNDTELKPLSDASLTPVALDGRTCPTSIGGVHAWQYSELSWGNARYIDDWSYAQAKLTGKNQIVYPESKETAAAKSGGNGLIIALSVVGLLLVVGGVIGVIVFVGRRNRSTQLSTGAMNGQSVQQVSGAPGIVSPGQSPPGDINHNNPNNPPPQV